MRVQLCICAIQIAFCISSYYNYVSIMLNPTKVIGTNSMRQFTLVGVSAGAFGVAFNCDAVAAAVKAKDPNAGGPS